MRDDKQDICECHHTREQHTDVVRICKKCDCVRFSLLHFADNGKTTYGQMAGIKSVGYDLNNQKGELEHE